MAFDPDHELRAAAFSSVRRLAEMFGHLRATELRTGFEFQGERIPFLNFRRGIFKPQRMRYLLSIRTVFPKAGNRIWYEDQRLVQQQIYQGDEQVDYAFMGSDPASADNRWLKEAWENEIPIIYFLGIAPGLYEAIIPTYIVGWSASRLSASIAFGPPELVQSPYPATPAERRYALREVRQRLHQASFREAVIAAYNGRCAISGLPETRLLDAAHIVEDTHERLGQPVVTNGLPLSKIHHAAFDAHMLGIDPDFRIHVARRLMDQHDGKMLDLLKSLQGQQIHLPSRSQDAPDRDRLAHRFDIYRGFE